MGKPEVRTPANWSWSLQPINRFSVGALVNVDKYYNKSLGMIVRQSRVYNWVVKRMNDGQLVLSSEDNMEVISAAR